MRATDLKGARVFVSYSHEQVALARLLERDLRRLARPVFGRARIRVIRDQLTLQPSSDLWGSIKQQLDEADHLVLLASSASAASHWVNRETAHFVAKHGVERVTLVIADGDAYWDTEAARFDPKRTMALSPEFQAVYTAQPLFVDLRWTKDLGSPDQDTRWRTALLDVASAITGLDKEAVAASDAMARKRALRLAWSAVTVLCALLIAASTLGVVAYLNGQKAESRLRAGQAHVGSLLAVVDVELSRVRGGRAVHAALLDQARTLMDRLGTPTSNEGVRAKQILELLYATVHGTDAARSGDTARGVEEQARALAIAEQVATAEDASSRTAAALAWTEAGTSALESGDLPLARARLERARSMFQRSYDEGHEPSRAFDLAVAVDRLGRVLFRMGDLDGAERLHVQGRDLVGSLPANEVDAAARALALAESEFLLFDVAAARKRGLERSNLTKAQELLDSIDEDWRLDVARRRLDLDLRETRFADAAGMLESCPRALGSAFSLLASEGEADDVARLGDALAVCPAIGPDLLKLAEARRAQLAASRVRQLRVEALLLASIGQGRATSGDPAIRTAAREQLLEAALAFERLIAAAPGDEALKIALVRTYQYLLNLQAPDLAARAPDWHRRCLDHSVEPRQRVDCVIASAPVLLAADIRSTFAALVEAAGQAAAINDGSTSARLREFQALRLAAVAAGWARQPHQATELLGRAERIAVLFENESPCSPVTAFVRRSIEQTRGMRPPP